MKVNKKLLPIKGHYFLFNAGRCTSKQIKNRLTLKMAFATITYFAVINNVSMTTYYISYVLRGLTKIRCTYIMAGTAPLVPYLSTYARQLGFSSATVGLIYTILPLFGLIAKPLFGIIADRFKIQKSMFIYFQLITIISFSLIYVVPEKEHSTTVELDCNGGVTVLRSCYANLHQADNCLIRRLSNETTKCQMDCGISTPKMWQTICEHWHLPEYCYSNTDSIQYKAIISDISSKNDCAYLAVSNVTLDDKYVYTPKCYSGAGHVDLNAPCTLNCANQQLSSAIIGSELANMTCVNNMTHYHLCSKDIAPFLELAKNNMSTTQCSAACKLEKKAPWRLMQICEDWEADTASSCHPKTQAGGHFPSNISFVGIIQPWTALVEHECVYIRMHEIKLSDNSSRLPYCPNNVPYENISEIFKSSCRITCDHILVNEIFDGASESRAVETSQFSTQFWLFFLMMIISWIGQAVVVTFADAICFNLLGDEVAQYGKQRLWGSVGWGIISLVTGVLIDHFSEGAYKNYTIAFILMFVFMVGDVLVSCFIRTESTKMSLNIFTDVGTLLTSVHTIVFMLWTVTVGLSTGLLWQFLFWHLEDVSGQTCNGSAYIKTLQGLVSAIQTFLGEIPFMFVSGYILKRLGHVNMMSLVLFAFGVRFILYSFLTNAWWVLPIEMLQGITQGMFYPTMTSYANVVSPPGTETTVQGLVGAVFEGVGASLGSFVGGRLYEAYGGWKTFQWFGIASLVFCALHVIVQNVIKDKKGHTGLSQGKDQRRPRN